MEKLRVGFLIDDMNVDYYVRDLINFVYNDKCFETPVLITGYKQPNDKLNKKLFFIFWCYLVVETNLLEEPVVL